MLRCDPDRTYTPNALAAATGVPANRIREAVRTGELAASTYGVRWLRIAWRDFEAWRDATRVRPGPSPAERGRARADALIRNRAGMLARKRAAPPRAS